MTLAFNLSKNVSNDTSTCQGEQLCRIILNLCINIDVMARTSSIYYLCFHLTLVTLIFNLHGKMLNDTSSPQGQQLYQIIFKSKYRSSGLEKPRKSMHAHTYELTHVHTPTKIVATVSLTASGLGKNIPMPGDPGFEQWKFLEKYSKIFVRTTWLSCLNFDM